jgi:hypothetical protein
VGPVCGAQLLVSSGDPSRMASEASFAALAGTSPVDASSGKFLATFTGPLQGRVTESEPRAVMAATNGEGQ